MTGIVSICRSASSTSLIALPRHQLGVIQQPIPFEDRRSDEQVRVPVVESDPNLHPPEHERLGEHRRRNRGRYAGERQTHPARLQFEPLADRLDCAKRACAHPCLAVVVDRVRGVAESDGTGVQPDLDQVRADDVVARQCGALRGGEAAGHYASSNWIWKGSAIAERYRKAGDSPSMKVAVGLMTVTAAPFATDHRSGGVNETVIDEAAAVASATTCTSCAVLSAKAMPSMSPASHVSPVVAAAEIDEANCAAVAFVVVFVCRVPRGRGRTRCHSAMRCAGPRTRFSHASSPALSACVSGGMVRIACQRAPMNSIDCGAPPNIGRMMRVFGSRRNSIVCGMYADGQV